MSLSTVADYITDVRALLQDTYAPAYRYSDADLLRNLNKGLIEALRVRPDIFLASNFVIPQYTAVDATVVVFPQIYAPSLVYYVVGASQLRDEEDTQDARAGVLLNKFLGQLLTLQA